ncbi:MAG: 2-oxoglutarate dehydrogenase E1 component [Rhodopirellula sp.]|nr:2-oxoglutarate dehydrogenase E1 component [Rhodopirellula sp.]
MPEANVNPSSLNVEYLEHLLQDYLRDPAGVALNWRQYFDRISQEDREKPDTNALNIGGQRLGPSFRPRGLFNPSPPDRSNGGGTSTVEGSAGTEMAAQLLRAYRERGHLAAQIDPLGRPRPGHPELYPEFYGLGQSDLASPVDGQTLAGVDVHSLGDLLDWLKGIYCRSVGVEFMHIDDIAVRQWLQQRMEASGNRLELGREEELRILSRLSCATSFEEFVQKKYVGAKTFSLEGAEILIALLDRAIERAGSQGVRQIVMGMAHRGRINVLANILGKTPRQIFYEFEDKEHPLPGGGDVKYHLGHSNDWITTRGEKVYLTLCFNPSHLEFVNPVAEGSSRAKQDRAGDIEQQHGMTVLVHGDAAFAGEGVVQETLNLSQLPGYTTGGTLHVILNNQIGFTTLPKEGRSTRYCSDVAKMLQIPIFHVNGEDPEAVAHVVDLAVDFRREFHRDVVIDLYCFRKHGHNESDEPEFTQPLLYGKRIRGRETLRKRYGDRLVQAGRITADEVQRMDQQCRDHLEKEHALARSGNVSGPSFTLSDVWRGYRVGLETPDEQVHTGVERQRLSRVLAALTELPEDFHLHPKLKRWNQRRRAMAEGEQPVDWSAAEALALATLSIDGYRIRLSGQDTGRGTFSHRHAILHDVEDGRTYVPLRHVAEDQAPVDIINSPLSEAGCLGFEYGYSLDYPDALVAWEAQFGDFWNVAQVIVDQFLASAEEKWRRLSGITLLLPHGFEGQGPEHSSARLERFLNLATQHNFQVVVPSTPAQYFHCLRRQMHRRWLKPLILFTPKSLLRHPRCVSDLDDLAHGHFCRVLPDAAVNPPATTRILLCCGKIYYELLEKREELARTDVAILRMEQIYPLPRTQLLAALDSYPDDTPVYWVQEEPFNMGASQFLKIRLQNRLYDRFPFQTISRRTAASPATGWGSLHRKEQQQLLDRAFHET